MSDKPRAASERILVGKPAAPAKPRAEIFTPGQGKGYEYAGKGGVSTAQPKPQPKPQAKAEPAPQAKPQAKPKPKPKAAAKPDVKPAAPKKPAPMPGRKPPKKTRKKTLSPVEQSQALAETVVTSFTDRLTQEAEAKGGSLSVEDLKAMNGEFMKQADDLKVVFEKSFEDYVVAREKASWEQSRKFPFDRMMVKTFSYMMEDDSRKLRRSDSVSRRILPGFFMALEMMLGPDKHQGYQGKCRAVVKILQKEYGANFEWEDIYESDDARAIVIDALIDLAHHFEDFDKRAEWFIDMVNTHLPPPGEKTTQTETDWTFSHEGFQQFFDALMSDLRDALDSEGGRLLITRRHGVDATVDMIELMKKLDKAAKPT